MRTFSFLTRPRVASSSAGNRVEHARLAAASEPAALQPGGRGVRVPVSEALVRPQVVAVLDAHSVAKRTPADLLPVLGEYNPFAEARRQGGRYRRKLPEAVIDTIPGRNVLPYESTDDCVKCIRRWLNDQQQKCTQISNKEPLGHKQIS